MAETQLSTYFWRNQTVDRYAEIRHIQADKLLPLQDLLAERNFRDIEGSLITAENLHNPGADSPIYREKRLNYVMLLNQLQCRSMMEIGFNWGYSASLLLEASPAGRLHSVDIAEHWYTPPAGDIITDIYPNRFRYTWKDSRQALLDELAAGNRYDMISVDGGHDYATATSDILLGVELLEPGGLLIVDDTDGPSVGAAVLATVAGHADMMELTAANFGLFEFGQSDIPCFEQRYFLKRVPLHTGARVAAETPVVEPAPEPPASEPETAPAPQPPSSLAVRAARKLTRMLGG